MPDGEVAASGAAPAVSSTAAPGNATSEGLGNFKGVMLCNPPERDFKKTNLLSADEKGPMKAGVRTSSLDPLGYGNKPSQLDPSTNRKNRPPPKSIEHRKWIKELEVSAALSDCNCFLVFRFFSIILLTSKLYIAFYLL